MHVEFEQLIRYHEGELAGHERNSLERHLAKCAECRHELDLLRQAAALGTSPAAPPLHEIVAGNQLWAEGQRRQGVSSDIVKWRVAAEISPYLGWAATGTILQAVSPDGHNLLSVVEPVLAVFLGRCAARVLVSHVVDCAIVRT